MRQRDITGINSVVLPQRVFQTYLSKRLLGGRSLGTVQRQIRTHIVVSVVTV